MNNNLVFPDTFKVSSLIKSPKQYNVEDLIKVIGNKIFKYDIANITVSYNDKLLDNLSTANCKLFAFLDKTPILHHYNLIIRTTLESSLWSIICHEMQHFDQYERGDLNIVDNKYFIWKGEQYTLNIDYEDRPWEKEAKAAERYLWHKFKKIYYDD